MKTGSTRRGSGWVAIAGVGLVAVVVVVASACTGTAPPTASATTGAGTCLPRTEPGTVAAPPAATPLPQAPADVGGDGTRATICTALGDVTMELFTASAPVAAQNFVNLAEAGYYQGSPFHRIVPGFMIQGGSSATSETGGPGFTIPDEPFAGEYVRGIVAMARTPQPNSQSSQFFILVADAPHLEGGGYTIFGRVTAGMEVVDEIVSGPRGGPQNDQALEPVTITDVSVQRP
jgi:peptidyl-prolyl cis-trans isomerase B (cyclophilin B)